MKFNEQWLREWVDPPVGSEELCEQLTMAGLEVEAVEPVASGFSGVVVGKVLSVAPHPQADRLQVCQVDVGEGEPLGIVCGARNVAPGMLAPVARVGARLGDDFTIKKARLRGVESQGMLCSAAELGLAEQSEGLMSLPEGARPGDDFRDFLQLDDVSIELGLTPNRSDCLGVAGIAREVGVINRSPVTEVDTAPVSATADAVFPIEVEDPRACPRYVGRVIAGVNARAQTPLWMQERLRRSGLRSISPVVDVTNYVMLELGQPMHAFDLDKLERGVRVRMAREGETIELLDGQQVTLAGNTLVIADAGKAIAMAGIMGGQETAVGDDTRTLFLESAFFSPQAIAGRARQYGLHTDSSHRFERGVDPELAVRAMERATRLLLEITGGEAGPVVEVTDAASLPRHDPITLRAARLRRLLGAAIPRPEVTEILRRLGFQVRESEGESWEVVSSSARFDIAIEADLIEEVARIHGYNHLPDSRPAARLAIESAAATTTRDRRMRLLLADRGYQEAITYSFVDTALQSLLDPEQTPIELANPISSETAVMRTSLWPGLVQAVMHNLNRQQRRARLFETGRKYLRKEGRIVEQPVVAGAVTGLVSPEQWGMENREVDYFDLKGDVEALLALGGSAAQGVRFSATGLHPALHPGQAARLLLEDGATVGWLGVLHPRVSKALKLDQNILVFEVSSNIIGGERVPVFHELSKFPAIRRDLAIIVDEDVPAASIRACIEETAGETLQQLQLFDVYHGKGIDSGKKSVALGLTLQAFSRTLTDSEIDALIARVLQQLQNTFAATLRE